ncbi:hypothetical protein SOVF_133920 [Spinacia oleracea]|nr:hypothetical protein SOVF_133920 [Spinacia oleracea]
MSQNNNNKDKEGGVLNIAFYPWFALGHLTSFLRLANKLAEKGHNISFFLPTKTQSKFASQNHYPNHLKFMPIDIPHVDGLPPWAETTNDVPVSAVSLIMTAMDLTRDTIESHLTLLKPDFVFYDFSYWMPELCRKLGIKSVHYITGFIARYAGLAFSVKEYQNSPGKAHQWPTPPNLPSQIFQMRPHEAKILDPIVKIRLGLKGVSYGEMFCISLRECDAIAVKTCKEMEQIYCEYIENTLQKPVLLAGPVVPKPPSSKLVDHHATWLNGFDAATVIYCALGSECALSLNQFQHLLLGLELTGKPFLTALKPPKEYETVESAFPDGFAERIKGRGIVQGGWVQQQLILQHPSVGCFITHCGAASLSEAMASQCQIVLMPQGVDQFTNAKQMSLELKIGVEVEAKEDDGLFTKEAINKAISLVMEQDSQIGREVMVNHAKWRDFILTEGLEDSYITTFIQSLQHLLPSF